MFSTKKSLRLVFLLLLLMGVTSCVKDVDLSKAEEISLQPDMQVDLLIFEVTEQDFIDFGTNQARTVIRDTVRLEFLDDDYIQNDLEEVELSFKYINSFPQQFKSSISFLSESDRKQYQVDFDVDPGNKNNPVPTEWIEYIDNSNIGAIKRSIKMVVELEVLPNAQEFSGTLNFQSKGLFSFQF
ncbi:hypothetical protein L1I30_11290 [Gillisia sp. M10.2A]|uniref:Uncharacterized protein n=1 Tax=Gillisia lutea TaxID=2909668 RepID=A0ABS9EHH0_9FLAO|nr:hypothetical protein [Gillisia lutea]MCF4102253.1 hypothetical protein [Gillisia lutea]